MDLILMANNLEESTHPSDKKWRQEILEELKTRQQKGNKHGYTRAKD